MPKLDNSQPWMKNPVIKARILLASRRFDNPVMEGYRQEFNAMALVDEDLRQERREEEHDYMGDYDA